MSATTNVVEKNPIMLLNELCSDAKYEVSSIDGSSDTKYKVQLTVDGKMLV